MLPSAQLVSVSPMTHFLKWPSLMVTMRIGILCKDYREVNSSNVY